MILVLSNKILVIIVLLILIFGVESKLEDEKE